MPAFLLTAHHCSQAQFYCDSCYACPARLAHPAAFIVRTASLIASTEPVSRFTRVQRTDCVQRTDLLLRQQIPNSFIRPLGVLPQAHRCYPKRAHGWPEHSHENVFQRNPRIQGKSSSPWTTHTLALGTRFSSWSVDRCSFVRLQA